MELNLGIPDLIDSKRLHPDFSRTNLGLPLPTHVNQAYLLIDGADAKADFFPWITRLHQHGSLSISHLTDSVVDESLTFDGMVNLSSMSDFVANYEGKDFRLHVMKGSPFITIEGNARVKFRGSLGAPEREEPFLLLKEKTPFVVENTYPYTPDCKLETSVGRYNGGSIRFANDELIVRVRGAGSYNVKMMMEDGKLVGLGASVSRTKSTMGIRVIDPRKPHMVVSVVYSLENRTITTRIYDFHYFRTWAIYGNCVVEGNELITKDFVQIAFVQMGISSENVKKKLRGFSQGVGSFAIRGDCRLTKELSFRFEKVGANPLLFYLPPHLGSSYFISDDFERLYPLVSFVNEEREFILGSIENNVVKFIASSSIGYKHPFKISFPEERKDSLKERLENIKKEDLSGYDEIGEWLVRSVKVLLEAHHFQMEDESKKETVKEVMEDYFLRKGPRRETHLYYDKTLGELVDETEEGNSLNFGNWIYTAAALKYLGCQMMAIEAPSILTKGLLAMLIDGCNPGYIKLTTKMRHRDFYLGSFNEMARRYYQGGAYLCEQFVDIVLRSEDLSIEFNSLTDACSRCYEVETAGLLAYKPRKKREVENVDEWSVEKIKCPEREGVGITGFVIAGVAILVMVFVIIYVVRRYS